MKLLPITEPYRKWLYGRNALRFDAKLDEHLVGLTHAESIFFVALSGPFAPHWREWTDADIKMFVTLYEKHVGALGYVSPDPNA